MLIAQLPLYKVSYFTLYDNKLVKKENDISESMYNNIQA